MTQEIQWGPAIAVDGKRPGFVGDTDMVLGHEKDGSPFSRPYPARHIYWTEQTNIALPVDHPHYRQTEAEQPTPQADTKPELTARMEALVRKMALADKQEFLAMGTGCREAYAEADAIVALLPEPVDPDVELVDEVMFGFGWEREDARFSDVHAVAFDCIKRGRALALAGEKEA